MDTLIISAAPSGRALTADLTGTATTTLRDQGHDVTVVDLHAIEWDPVVRAADYGQEQITAPVGALARRAIEAGTTSPAVRRQQELLLRADLVVLVFPLWWGGMPAILKGWVDRVLTEGFAYGLHDADGNPRKYGDGAFAGTRGLVITTAGDRESAFAGRGVNGCIEDLLFPITHGILWYTGIAPLPPLSLLGVDTPAWPGIDDAREQVRAHLATVRAAAPIPYRRLLEDYDEHRVLTPGHAPGRTDLGVHRAS